MKTVFRVVHDKEVRELFSRLGLLSDLESGVITCAGCGRVISEDNFRAVGRVDDKLVFVCDQRGCQSVFPEAPGDEGTAQ